MKDRLRLCIVGAGSSYTPELIEGILTHAHDDLPVDQLNLCDIDGRRLNIMAGLAERTFRQSGRKIVVRSDTRLEPMLEEADFVIAQIRVGGMEARHLDESIPLKYGILGQETTGPGGMCKALRTIPVILEVARAVARIAPDAFILNYTNPSGILTEAVTRYTPARFIGLCSGIPGIQKKLGEELRGSYPDLKSYSVGLNHLGFLYRFTSNGRDVTQEAIRRLCETRPNVLPCEARLVETMGAVPMSYLNYYFHRTRAVKTKQAEGETRAQVVKRLQEDILRQAAESNFVGKPDALKKRGGGGYSGITFDVLRAILRDTGDELVMSVPNCGTVDGIPADASVEVSCRVGKEGPQPIRVGPIPASFRGLVQAVKAYESLTVEAAMQRSRRLALQALLNHPLVGDMDIAEPLLSELISAHKLELS